MRKKPKHRRNFMQFRNVWRKYRVAENTSSFSAVVKINERFNFFRFFLLLRGGWRRVEVMGTWHERKKKEMIEVNEQKKRGEKNEFRHHFF